MENRELFELTNPQKSIWYTEQFYSGTTVNNICTSGTIYGKIDENLLKQAINNVVKQNDSFRIHVVLENNIAKQYIADYKEFNIDVEYINDESEIERVEKEEVKYKFDVIDSDLFKFKLAISEGNFACIILTVNHLIADSWALGLVIQEILRNYNALKNNEEITQETFSYVDYINSEKEYKSGKKFENDKSYWNEIFETIPEQATIPSLNNSIKNLSYNAKRLSFEINKELLSKINDFCRENNISIFNFFMAIFSIYIGRVSNIDDFVIGTPILNRSNFKEKHTTGMFVNTVPVRVNNLNDGTFKNLASNFATKMMGILRHQKYSYNSVLEDLRAKNENVPNLYNIIISYQVTKAFDEKFGNYKTNWTFNNYCANDFNIHIYDINDTGDLIINYDYLIDKYSDEDVTVIHTRIIHMINQILNDNDISSSDIEIVTPEEKDKILNVFNNTAVDYPRNKTIVDLFEEQVEKTPDNVAVVFEDKKLTYRELNEKANSLAKLLVSKSIKANDFCAIILNRSLEMIISILAVLKSGAAYIPIDPSYPKDRIEYILKDSNVKVVLTEDEHIPSLSTFNLNIINIKESENFSFDTKNLNIEENLEDLSYIIYTSGSTGKPKGVMLKKGSLTNLANYCNNYVEYLKNPLYKAIVSVTTVSFDIFIFETLISLQRGLKLVIANENAQTNPVLLNNIIEKENIEIMQTTPSRIKLLLNDYEHIPCLKNIKYLTLAGEQLPLSLVNELKSISEDITIYNGYGPSETTVFSTLTDITDYSQITIGRPLDNTAIYILDNNKNLCPIGVAGELYIAGDGVGKGYINNPTLTEKSFIKNIFNNGSIMYKTGDIGFYKEDGEIVCLGRSDSQVKIRGLRIELSEIEQQLLKISNICNCCVVKKSSENRDFLCAYYTKEGPVNEKNLRIALKQKLPQYMIPQYFVELEQLPYTPNGKIDKRAFPEPIIKNTKINISYRNEIDVKLANILKSLLGIDNIDISNSLLELGGDSLTAINLSAKIRDAFDVDVYVKDILSKDSIADLSDYISGLSNTDKSSFKISPAEEAEFYPLSSAQKRIYYASKMIGDENIVYNIPGAILVNSVLDKEKVEKCFKEIIKKQSSFRTSFFMVNDSIMQKINKSVNFKINTFENKSTEINNLINTFPKAFNLENAPLLRVELYYLDTGKTLLLLESHHIIMDGSSLEILINEFCKLYNGENIDKLDIEYKDFSVWENKFLESDMVRESENYWLSKFKDSEIPAINLPYDFSVPSSRSYKGNTISRQISEKDFDKYIISSKKFGVSPYIFFLSALFVLLYKYTGQEEIIVGSPVTGRNNNQLQDIIGMFVNNIAVDGKIDSSKKFTEFLNTIRQQVLSDLEYQNYPYNSLVKKLNIPNDSTNNPLFDVMFAYQNANSNKLTLGDESVEIIKSASGISKFNLSIEIEPDTRMVNLEYRTDLFKEDTINRLFEHFINTLNVISENNDILIKDISIISEEEKNKILYEFNATAVNYPNDKSIIELFEEQVEKNPDNVAIVFENQKLTYVELNKRANSLANYLKFIGITNNDVICISLNRSFELIIALYAVLKSGASYVLIDPSLPQERINYIINNSESKYCIINNSTSNLIKILNPINISNFDFSNYITENLSNIPYNDNLCIIYTSGSTGNPKGVLLHKRGFLNLVFAFDKEMHISKYANILGIATVSFDMFMVELFSSTLFGNTLILANEEEQKNSVAISNLIKQYNVDFFVTTPSRIELLLQDECNNPLNNVKAFQLGGEKLSSSLYNKLRNNTNAKIFNGYGPTEITACCTNKLVTSSDITIGNPISNVQVYICDSNMNLSPIGIIGEICVSGIGVSNGYLNNTEANSKNFVKNPFGDGFIYKTGDLGKFRPNGEIEYVGRSDFQIKIKGLRIELSEIESKLNALKTVDSSVLLYKSNCKFPYLIAFVLSKDIINVHNLKLELSKTLPSYMIPRYIIQLDNFPITQNGKINKKALENYESPTGIMVNSTAYVPPKNEKQKLFCDIWSSLLNIDVGIDDDLFDIGADSLLAISFKTKLLSYNIDLPYADIFKYRTIRKLCNISRETTSNLDSLSSIDYKEIDKLLKSQNDKIIESSTHHNVLLLGGTGYVGMHIINSFIKNSNGKIYCIVRDKNKTSSLVRFMELLHFYFGNKLDKYINNRIFVLKGDVLKDNFALSNKTYDFLANEVDTVINTVANVKHYGSTNKFKKINIDALNIAIRFCLKYQKRFIHISSLSISGNMLFENTSLKNEIFSKNSFTENDLYVGQSLDNVYTKSKFEAEKLILNYIIRKNLNAQILRLGNITSRFSDGHFQINPEDNAFANRLKSFISIKCIPEYLLNDYMEFTPVDVCADAILNILNNNSKNRYIYHVYNDNHLYISELIDYLSDLGFNINIVAENEFAKKIDSILSDNTSTSLSGIINDLGINHKLDYSSHIQIIANDSKRILNKYNFKWPKIKISYIKKYISYLKKINFIK